MRHWIPTWQLENLEAKIAKINRKATKLQNGGATCIVTGASEIREIEVFEKQWYKIKFIEVDVEGTPPQVEGWKFVGLIEHIADKNFLKSVNSTVTIPSAYSETAPVCEHCGAARLRTKTYILEKDGVFKQVGKNCLADFIGGYSPEYAAGVCESISALFRDLSEGGLDWDSRGNADYGYNLKRFLECASFVISQHGYVGRRKAEEEVCIPTSSLALLMMEDKKSPPPRPEDTTTAEAVISWMSSLSQIPNKSEYQQNLLNLAEMGWVPNSMINYAASAVLCWMRENGERRAAKYVSEYVGEVGQRGVFDLTLVGLHAIETMYGTMTIARFVDAEKRVFIWKTNPYSFDKLEIELEQTKKIKASIKSHSEYKGLKQTLLTRCSGVK